MEKRFFLALLLTGAVVVLTPIVFPRPKTSPAVTTADSTPAVALPLAQAAATSVTPATAIPGKAGATVAVALPQVAETLVVRTALSAYTFSALGATPLQVQADSYPALNGLRGRVTLRHGKEPLLRFRIVTAGDTILLDRMAFEAARGVAPDGSPTVNFASARGGTSVSIGYRFTPDNYLATANVQVTGLSGPAFLLVDLPTGFDTQEADSLDDIRHLSYAVKPQAQGARGIPFTKLDEGEARLEPGPLAWVVAKNKYFLVGLLVPTGGKPFAEAHVIGGARTRKLATRGADRGAGRRGVAWTSHRSSPSGGDGGGCSSLA